jgi:D-glycero-beta-D-manno-heptose-7-phosphate kinase
MYTLSVDRLNSIFSNFSNKKIAIVGDLMLDRYMWGSVSRISPEAPVPVVDVLQDSNRLGGAANVANNINTLGCEAYPIGIIGNDSSGKVLTDLMAENQFNLIGLVVDDSVPTTVKTRIIAHNQHVVRIDRENKSKISKLSEDKIIEIIKENINIFDAIIIEDYNKGVVSKRVIDEIITISKKHKKPVTVDPKFHNFKSFKNVKVFKPNRKEAEEALGIKIDDETSTISAMKLLMNELQCESVLLTMGEKGMALLEPQDELTFIKTRARKIADVSGAGDTVIAALTVALVSGANIKESSFIANFAAGIVCEEVGAVPIRKDILFNSLLTELKTIL